MLAAFKDGTKTMVEMAAVSNATVIGFNVRPDRNAAEVADREKVDIRQHSIIYNVTDEMKKAMAGLLEPTMKETRMGVASVRQGKVFDIELEGTDPKKAEALLKEAADKLLANTVIENYRVEVL